MKKYSGQFRSATWDPILIISQIVALQAVFYVSLGGILFFMDTLFGSSRSLDHLFKYQEIHVRDLGGKLVIAGFVINALLGSLGLWFIVERTKQCLDFSSTTHLIHLIACWNYNSSFPNTISWWLLNIACLTIMCVSGEFLCLRMVVIIQLYVYILSTVSCQWNDFFKQTLCYIHTPTLNILNIF